MKCAIHPEVDAAGYCRNCGKALCTACSREVRGMIYCEACLADLVTQPRPVPQGAGNPGVAAVLGFVPGLGAVYNAEYTKAIIHVVIFAALVGILSGYHPAAIYPVTGILLAAFIIYMSIDAYRSAKARLAGTAPPDALAGISGGKPVWPFVLIGLGFLFLLQNFGWLNLDRVIDVWWPMLLIGAGGLLAWRRMEDQR